MSVSQLSCFPSTHLNIKHPTMHLHLIYVSSWCAHSEKKKKKKKKKKNRLNLFHQELYVPVSQKISIIIWHILHHQREACDLPQKSVTQPPRITVKYNKLNGQKDARYLSWSEPNQQQPLRNISLLPSCHAQPDEHETLGFLNLLTARPWAAESSIRTIIHLQTHSVSSWLADAWADKHTVCTLEADQVKACSIFWHMLVFVQEGERKCAPLFIYACH